MPKIIKDLRPRIISCAKQVLIEKGYTELTIRAVATQCNIAVGTVYNYFQSKDILAASVMIDDFSEALDEAAAKAIQSNDVLDGLNDILQLLISFMVKFGNLRKDYAMLKGCQTFTRESQFRLKKVLEQILGSLLDRTGYENSDFIRKILSDEMLILCNEASVNGPMSNEEKREYLSIVARILVKKA